MRKVLPRDKLPLSRERHARVVNERVLVRIEAPHFVAAVIIEDGVCIEAAPIMSWAIGKTEQDLVTWFNTKGWENEVLK